MKSTLLSVLIFIILLAGGGYLVRDQNIPILSQVGSDIRSIFFEEESESIHVESKSDLGGLAENKKETQPDLLLEEGTNIDFSKTSPVNLTKEKGIFVEENNLFIDGFVFEIPAKLKLIEESDIGVAFVDNYGDNYKFAIGYSLSPTGNCDHQYFLNTRTGKGDVYDSNVKEEETDIIFRYGCYNKKYIGEVTIPMYSYEVNSQSKRSQIDYPHVPFFLGEVTEALKNSK